MRNVSVAAFLSVLVAFGVAGCGRTELDFPEDVPHPDVPLDRADVQPGCRSNAECDNGVFCDGTELCVAGSCQSSPPVDCSDGVSCTDDACSEATRMCQHVPDAMQCPAGSTCDLARGCVTTGCVSDAQCDDGDPCDGTEACRAGMCVRGSPPSCDDGVACTIDQCAPGRGCLNTPLDSRCDDGVFCNGAERCSASARGCMPGPVIACDDGNVCTQDTCSEAVHGCLHPPLDADGDGFPPIACRGTDCNDSNPRVNPGATEVCNDGVDENCDGRVDCADPFCAADPTCGTCMPSGAENSAAACHDGRDNDCNRFVDCADPACMPFCGCVPTGPEFGPASCTDGLDNDCNGLTDCAEPTCRTLPACAMCVPTGPETGDAACGDGRDDDCDGAVDCADTGCAAATRCTRPANDTCMSATDISVPGDATGSTTNATDDFRGSCDFGNPSGPDVVYRFTNPTTQTLVIDTLGSSFDTVLIVHRPDCVAGPEIACNDDSVGLQSRLVLTGAAPGVYFVVVDGFSNTSFGAYQLHITVGPREICNNGIDDDGNGLTDCADPVCAPDPACGMMCVPTGPEVGIACSDGRDNDCNGLIDCVDPSCRTAPRCTMCVPTGPETNNAACGDGRDDDCDGLTDCADPDCRGFPACPMCIPTGAETTMARCSDGRDNDCDGRIDCADTDCARQPFCMSCVPTGAENTPGACADGRDDDCNGAVDCADTGCSGVGACACVAVRENTDATCSDGRDEDCDRLVDCADPDCAGTTPCRVCVPTGAENTAATCSDGRDDDCDMLIDCADPGCATTMPCMVCRPSPENTVAACTDGVDNDCDGAIDCADANCATTMPCSVVGDNCSSPIRVGVPGTAMGTTVGARDDYQPSCGVTPSGPDVVYFFDNPTTQTVSVDTFGSTFDTVLVVRGGRCEGGTQLGCDDDDSGTTDSRVVLTNLAPGRYWVVVDGFGGASGTYQLHITLPVTQREICNNGLDDDGDGLLDCTDPDCAADPSCVCHVTGAENTTLACANGRDDDCDGLVDCADPECAMALTCCARNREVCNDRVDNNCNGLTDCADAACRTDPACVTTCTPTAGSEQGPAACSNGRDDDCDGVTDCNDPDCSPFGTQTGGECCNGRDDNGNGIVDEFACTCGASTQCIGIGAGGVVPSPACYASLGVCGPSCALVGGDQLCSAILPGSTCNFATGECVAGGGTDGGVRDAGRPDASFDF